MRSPTIALCLSVALTTTALPAVAQDAPSTTTSPTEATPPTPEPERASFLPKADNDIFGLSLGAGLFPTLVNVRNETRTYPAPFNLRMNLFMWSDHSNMPIQFLDLDMGLLLGAVIALSLELSGTETDPALAKAIFPVDAASGRSLGYGHAMDMRVGASIADFGPVDAGFTMYFDLGGLQTSISTGPGTVQGGTSDAGTGYFAVGAGPLLAWEPTERVAVLVNPAADAMFSANTPEPWVGLGGRADVDVIYGVVEDIISLRLNVRGEHRWFRFSETTSDEATFEHFRVAGEVVFALDGLFDMEDY